MIKTVNALVFSRMYYCSSVWCNTSKKNFAKLQTLQNCAPRIVTKIKKYDHITPALKQLDWLPVDQMLRLRDTTMAFKCLKGLAPSYLSDRFIKRSDIYNRNTRNKNLLQIPKNCSSAGQRSFLYRAVMVWNNLPGSVTCIDSYQEP